MSLTTLLIVFAFCLLALAATGGWYLLRQMRSLSDAHAANERALASELTSLAERFLTTNQELTALAAARDLQTYQGILAMRDTPLTTSESEFDEKDPDDGEDDDFDADRLLADLDPIAFVGFDADGADAGGTRR